LYVFRFRFRFLNGECCSIQAEVEHALNIEKIEFIIMEEFSLLKFMRTYPDKTNNIITPYNAKNIDNT
jgi:hypothetical protein